MTRFLLFLLALFLLLPAWAADEACVVCSAEQARYHLESCSFSTEHQGKTYHFCEKACLEKFQSEPDSWVARFQALEPAKPTATTLPAFEFPLKPAGTLSSQDVAGKVLLLNLWATWCGPCQEEMPDLVRLQEELGDQGLIVLAISFDKTEQAHRQGIKDLELNFPSIFAQDEAVKKFLAELGPVSAIPVTFIVDKEGRILERIEGKGDYERFRKAIEPLLPKAQQTPEQSFHGSVAPS